MLTRKSQGLLIAITLVAVTAYFGLGASQSSSPSRDIVSANDRSSDMTSDNGADSNGRSSLPTGRPAEPATNLLRPSLGKFDELTVPVRDAPSKEHPDVAAAYAGEPNSLYETLVKLGTAGNAVASLSLYGLLGNCDKLYKTEEELEAAINRMYDSRRTANATSENTSDTFDTKAVEYNVRRTFAQCQPIPESAVRRRSEWLAKAANDGSPQALYAYGDTLVSDSPKQALQVFERLWEMGGAMGADKISKMYEAGWEGQEPDLVKAAAYGFIATEYSLEYFDSIDNEYGSAIFEQMKKDHAAIQTEYLMRIKPAEFDQAFDLAQRLLEENANCCFN